MDIEAASELDSRQQFKTLAKLSQISAAVVGAIVWMTLTHIFLQALCILMQICRLKWQLSA